MLQAAGLGGKPSKSKAHFRRDDQLSPLEALVIVAANAPKLHFIEK